MINFGDLLGESLPILVRLGLFLALAYFLYWQVFIVYYKYWFYTSQGIPNVGFPLPFINNGLKIIKSFSRINQVKWTVLEEYWHSASGFKILPPILAEFSNPNGMVIISDPVLVQELYI